MASPHGFRGLGTVPQLRPAEQRGSRLSLPSPSQPLRPSLSEGLAAPSVTRSFSRAHFGEASQSPPANAGDRGVEGWTPGWEDPLEEGMATHPGIPAGRIPRTQEPGGLQSLGSRSQKRRKRLSTEVSLPPPPCSTWLTSLSKEEDVFFGQELFLGMKIHLAEANLLMCLGNEAEAA